MKKKRKLGLALKKKSRPKQPPTPSHVPPPSSSRFFSSSSKKDQGRLGAAHKPLPLPLPLSKREEAAASRDQRRMSEWFNTDKSKTTMV